MSGWPEDADAVIRRIRAELASAGDQLDGLEAVRISAELRGDDLEQLTVDASGVDLRMRPAAASASSSALPAPASPDIRIRRPGVARRARLRAAPVLIDGVPLTFDAEVIDAPIDWIEYVSPVDPAHPETAFAIDSRDGGEGVRGSLSASMRVADVGPLIERLAGAALEAEGVAVRSVRVDVDQDGADGIRVFARARVRWKLLSASARAKARLRITPDAVVTVQDLTVGSRNPIVALALRAARTTVRAQIGRTIDLNGEVPLSALRLHSLRVTVARDVSVEARLG